MEAVGGDGTLMLDHDKRIIHSSVESNWRTPPDLFLALDNEFDFTLDAAADERSHLTPEWLGPGGRSPDALDPAVRWCGRIFLNPPYSKKEKMPIEPWLKKCWLESLAGATIVALIPFSPQTEWYRQYVYGHGMMPPHCAVEERRLPYRVSYLRPDGSPAGNAGVNTAIIVWKPTHRIVWPFTPHSYYWSYR